MITPQKGWIVDPANSNNVIPDPSNLGPAPTPVSSPPSVSTPVAPTVTTPTTSSTPAPVSNSVQTSPAPTSEDQKLLNLGISPDQLKQLNSPQGMDPASFQSLVDTVETKLKTNNDLVTTRGYIIKHLYDSPLTADEMMKLPVDIQKVLQAGDKNSTELQLRLLNDQIAGRANTLHQSIATLTHGYETAVTTAENQRKDAINTVLQFAQTYGAQAPTVLKSLYGAEYLDKLKAQGIDIEAMSSAKTVAEQKASAAPKIFGSQATGYFM